MFLLHVPLVDGLLALLLDFTWARLQWKRLPLFAPPHWKHFMFVGFFYTSFCTSPLWIRIEDRLKLSRLLSEKLRLFLSAPFLIDLPQSTLSRAFLCARENTYSMLKEERISCSISSASICPGFLVVQRKSKLTRENLQFALNLCVSDELSPPFHNFCLSSVRRLSCSCIYSCRGFGSLWGLIRFPNRARWRWLDIYLKTDTPMTSIQKAADR